MKNKKYKISYEPEADILRIEISKKPLYDAVEFGNFIIHFDKERHPIYMEIVSAKDFLLQSNRSIINKLPRFEKVLIGVNT